MWEEQRAHDWWWLANVCGDHRPGDRVSISTFRRETRPSSFGCAGWSPSSTYGLMLAVHQSWCSAQYKAWLSWTPTTMLAVPLSSYCLPSESSTSSQSDTAQSFAATLSADAVTTIHSFHISERKRLLQKFPWARLCWPHVSHMQVQFHRYSPSRHHFYGAFCTSPAYPLPTRKTWILTDSIIPKAKIYQQGLLEKWWGENSDATADVYCYLLSDALNIDLPSPSLYILPSPCMGEERVSQDYHL